MGSALVKGMIDVKSSGKNIDRARQAAVDCKERAIMVEAMKEKSWFRDGQEMLFGTLKGRKACVYIQD